MSRRLAVLSSVLVVACDGGATDAADSGGATDPAGRDVAVAAPVPEEAPCPADMVHVAESFCIDRFEGSLVALDGGEPLSPHYHPRRDLAVRDWRTWEHRARRIGPWRARRTPLPLLPAAQRESDVDFVARSAGGVVPSGYLDLESAGRACAAAGKRLCSRTEWTTACRGEARTRHPYGPDLEPGKCNLGRQHPSNALHGRVDDGLLDPRLHLVTVDGEPLLAPTGRHVECASRWGDDAIYDMVGNLDEWIDDPAGTFLGGVYTRETPWGCDAAVEIHSPDYYDYGLGVRCCR